MQRNEDDSALGRLNAMSGDPDPLVIVPATDPPRAADLGGPPTMAMPPVADPYATVVDPYTAVAEPVVPVLRAAEPVVPVVAAQPPPVMTRTIDPPLSYPERRDWGPVFAAAFIALLIGGVVGFLVGRGGDDDDSTIGPSATSAVDPSGSTPPSEAEINAALDSVFTVLLSQAEQSGSVVLPTPYPKLDQLLTLAAADTASQVTAAAADVSAITAERDQLAQQVATLEAEAATLQQQLTTAEQERDELQTQVDAGSGSAEQTTRQIEDLQEALADTQEDLQTANDDLATAQADLATATTTLEQLGPTQAPNVVGRSVGEVRNIARTNGWQVVERSVENTGAPLDSVTVQVPTPNGTMIKGSVLYVEVAKS